MALAAGLSSIAAKEIQKTDKQLLLHCNIHRNAAAGP
jgi:hypothetical protein